MSKDELGVQEVSPGYEFIAENPAVPVGYKLTEVGVIPDDWDTKQLNCVCTMKSGESITSKKISDHALYACYGGNGLRGFTDRYTHDGDFALIGRQGALCGNVVRVKGKFFASEHAVVVSPNKGIDIKWLAYVLDTMNLNRFSESSAQPGLSVSKVLLLPLLVPSSQLEQQAIATALSDVDALLEELDRLIAKKRDIKQAAMQQLLTGETRLPGFEGEWHAKRLGDIAELHRLNVVPANQPEQLFVHFSLPAFDEGQTATVELGASIGSNKFRVPQTSVLVSKLNPRIPRIWMPEVIPPNSCASTEWLILTPQEGVERMFLYVLCSSQAFCQQMEMAATGTTGSHQRISSSMALDIQVRVPVDREEQTIIAKVLSDMDAEIQALEHRRSKTAELKQGMMQELLTGRTRLV